MSVEVSSQGLSAQTPNTSSDVMDALRQASRSTGTQFDYLLSTAIRESSLDPSAEAKTSSAAGLFQFIEQTWLGAVKAYGSKHGLGDFAARIETAASGGHGVRDAATRQEILDLRFDPTKAAALAGELANENRSVLERQLGRAASAADLYTAHFLGPAGALKLLRAGSNVSAASLAPAAANANRHVFYDGDRARSVGEVLGSIASTIGASISGSDRERVETGGSTLARNGSLPDLNAVLESVAPAAANDDLRGTAARSSSPVNSVQSSASENNIAAQFSNAPRTPASPVIQLSSVVLSVLNALDPTRLNRRDDQQ